ncbi:acyl-ACP--UDP-N-acetylglucosamine O-acyltransferase [Lacipirellula sp.]|uniref:acyl-ACP--UDP-N-acetylglucosamine O-acyltransferase n=1 Tax=Lacipirellula sp. TaxID=2691419 RepID=UPI003D0DDCA6
MPIHPTAVIDSAAEIDGSASIGPHAVVSGPVTIGPDCVLSPAAIVMGYTMLEAGCRLHSRAVVGDAPQDLKYYGEASYCRIGEGSVIREGATVHHGTAAGTATIIGKRCLLMTNSHVGHNCELSDDVILVSGALLGGHVHVGPRAIISGNAAVHQHVRIGELSLVGMLARITQDVPPFCITDQEGNVVAENRVGMKRAGLTLGERAELRAAFGAIYRSGIGRNAAVQYLQDTMTTEAGRRLLAFYAHGSARGSGMRLYDPGSAA